MKNKHIILIGLFCCLIFSFPLMFLFSKENISISEEKRELVGLPNFKEISIEKWPESIEEYFRDHLPLRHKIIRFNAAFNKKAFNSTTSTQIMVGQNNWLFMKNNLEDKNLSDYQGLNKFSPQEIEKITGEFSLIASQQKEMGRKVILLIPPNKERVYSKYLPKGIPQLNNEGRAQQLYKSLEGSGEIILADPTQALMDQAAKEDDLYYKYDAHWTSKGAYIGFETLLNSLGIKTKDFDECQFEKTGQYYSGDIAALGGLGDLCNDDDIYKLKDGFNFEFMEQDSETINNMKVCTSDAEDKRKVLFLGDSFSYELKVYMAQVFSQVGYASFTESSQETIDLFEPEIIIVEQVERHLGSFNTYLSNYVK